MERPDHGVSDERRPIQPEAVAGTDEALREGIRRALVPRWVAALRTRVFTGLAVLGLVVGCAAEPFSEGPAAGAVAVPWQAGNAPSFQTGLPEEGGRRAEQGALRVAIVRPDGPAPGGVGSSAGDQSREPQGPAAYISRISSSPW